MKISFAVLALMVMGTALRPALAAPMDDYLAKGYEIARSTTVAGTFHGCSRYRIIQFSDGSSFSCSRATSPRYLVNSRVYILRKSDDPDIVVLINGQAFAGTITSWGGKPEKFNAISLPPVTPESTVSPAITGQIPPIPSIESILQLQNDRTTRLNDAQIQPVLHAPTGHAEDSTGDGVGAEQAGAGARGH
ncbi:MAG TPA: hypothetical protein VNX86_03225 [Rhizomicrobium sp.]|jgi:hypothetical protein|nr:hypothetical protein [Rhizomicrobium sp.]